MSYLLLHGLGGDRDQALNLVGPALPEGARVYAPDLRAHGDSAVIGGPAEFSFAAMSAELADGIRSEGLGDTPLTVIGISLGAALTLQLARLGTLPIESLVLLRPAFTDQPVPPNLAVFPVIGELLRRHGAAKAERVFRGTGLYRRILRESPLGAQGVIDQFRRPDAEGRAVRLVELPRNRAFLPGEQLTVAPATIIAAPRDPVHPLAVAQLWNRSLPGSTLVTLPARDDGLKAYVDATRTAVGSALRG